MAKFKDQEGVYHLQFNKESDNNWYIDFPGWPFSHHNLMMVAGADDLCEAFSFNGKTKVLVSTDYGKFNVNYKRISSSLLGGATYELYGIVHKDLPKTIWLCPVTLTVMGTYPEYLSIENDYDGIFPDQISPNYPVDKISKLEIDSFETNSFDPKVLFTTINNLTLEMTNDMLINKTIDDLIDVRKLYSEKPYLFKRVICLNH